MGAILALACKDLLQLVRDRGNLFFTVAFPIGFAVLFGFIFGGGGERGKIRLLVVDLDASAISQRFVQDLRDDGSFEVGLATGRDEGVAQVRSGKAAGLLVLPQGFGEASRDLFSGRGATIEGVIDPARSAERGLLEGKLMELGFRQLSRSFGDTNSALDMISRGRRVVDQSSDLSPAERLLFSGVFGSVENLVRGGALEGGAAASGDGASAGGGMADFRPITLQLEELRDDSARPRSSFEVSFPQGLVWAMMGCVTGFGAALGQERSRGTLTRLTLAPVTKGVILAGKALACFVTCLLVQGLLLTIGAVALGVRVSEPATLLLAMLCGALAFTGMTMLVAGLARSESGAAGAGRAVVLVLAMIGGGTIPVFFMPKFMQTIANVSPFTWSTLAVEGGLWRSMSPLEAMLPLGVLVLVGVVTGVLGVMLMRWQSA